MRLSPRWIGGAAAILVLAAAALVAAAEAPWDLVLTDLNLPGMHGLALCERLVADRPDVPVIVLTAKVLTDEESRELEAATIGVLSKHGADERTVAEEVRSILQG